MTTVSEFDPAEPLGDGRTVIEASAGTGKTFTIASQVTRIIAEVGIPIDKILVVTFTRAATAELKGRIRERLVETRHALTISDTGGSQDPHIRVLLAADDDARARSIERLNEAIVRFDRAQIFTIHGFAIRLLAHLGFHARISPDLEPIDVDNDLIRQVVSDLIVQRFADDDTDLVNAKGLAEIAEAVVGSPEAPIVPEVATVTGVPAVRAELANAAREQISRRLMAGGKAGYDQFLIEARDALNDPEIGTQAVAVLARRFAVALVDESQDTDPVQWEIINAVFADSQLVIIGDPKQSIYGFRGADIESYLASIEDAETRRTLLTNWRSDGPLIEALDVLFANTTFGDDRIPYREVRPAAGNENARIHGQGAAFTIRRFDAGLPIPRYRGRSDKPFNRAPSVQVVAADVGAEIVRLLDSGTTIDGPNGPLPVGPEDIAVLCQSGRQVDMVRGELTRRNVPSVAARSGSVFATEAATEWRRLLIGIERPDRGSTIRYAATGILVGMSLAEAAMLDDDDAVELQAQMQRWNELLVNEGVTALFADVSRRTGLAVRVMGRPDGERLMTDIMHIAESMDHARSDRRLGSVLTWLEDAIREAGKETRAGEAEARERRLETDAAAVHVQTTHGAKGLEYPIVLAPFLWNGWKPKAPSVAIFHAQGEDGTRRRMIDVGGKEYAGFAEHLRQAIESEDAQDARVLYVALTRAKHRLVVWWIDEATDVEKTNLHRLLVRGAGDDEDLARLDWLVDNAGGTIEIQTMKQMPGVIRYEPQNGDAPALHAATFDRTLDYAWRRVSFSSLSPRHPITPIRDTDDEPLRDDETVDEPPDEVSVVGAPIPMATIPGGMAFGTLVHRILEHVPFDADDLDAVVRGEVESAVRLSSWDLDLDALVEGLTAAIRTPLGPDVDATRLRDIAGKHTLDEMGFEFPVRNAGTAMTLSDIAETMQDVLSPDDPVWSYADLLKELPGAQFRGFLNGFIDLTAVVPDTDGVDRYVVMDYKTNTLTRRGEMPAVTDYSYDAMHRSMEHSHYLLQSLLYQVALHRYLQWRLPGYDPDRHLGGSMYLFVRGMIGKDTPVIDGERCGVYRWAPPPEMIIELSRRFASEQGT